jgi:hypothetical protein
VPVTEVLAANGPVPAPLPVGFDVLAPPLLRRRSAAIGLLGFEIRLVALVLLHHDSPKAKAPPVRAELFSLFYSISSEYQVERINLPNIFCRFGV